MNKAMQKLIERLPKAQYVPVYQNMAINTLMFFADGLKFGVSEFSG